MSKVFIIILFILCFLTTKINSQNTKNIERIGWRNILSHCIHDDEIKFSIKDTIVTLSDIEFLYDYYSNKKLDTFLISKVKNLSKVRRNVWKGNDIFLNKQVTFPGFHKWNIPDNIIWNENPFNHRSWQFILHKLEMINYLIAASEVNDDENYILLAKEFFLDWCKKNMNDNYPTTMSWHDHATALRLEVGVNLFVSCKMYKLLDEQFLKTFLSFVWMHSQILSQNDFYSKHNNHGFTQSYILFYVSKVFYEFFDSKEWTRIGKSRTVDEATHTFSSNGIHLENSPFYHVGQWARLMFANKLFKYYTNKPIVPNFLYMMNNAMVFTAYIIKPDLMYPVIGDSPYKKLEINKVWNDYSYLYGYQYLLYLQSKGAKGIKPQKTDIVFEEEGYSVFRDEWKEGENFTNMLHLIFKSGYKAYGHRHNDDCSLLLYAFGEDWITEGGMYTYKRDSIRNYVISNKAHNVVIFDNLDYNKGKLGKSKIKAYSISKDSVYVEGEHLLYKDVYTSRTIKKITMYNYQIIDSLIPVNDKLHDYKVIFHVPYDKKIKLKKNNVYVYSKLTGKVLKFIPQSDFDSVYVEKGKDNLNFPCYSAYSSKNIKDTYCIIFEKQSNKLESTIEISFSDD